MSLTGSIRESETGRARGVGRPDWPVAVAGVGFPVAMFLLSLYAPPVIRRALGKETDE